VAASRTRCRTCASAGATASASSTSRCSPLSTPRREDGARRQVVTSNRDTAEWLTTFDGTLLAQSAIDRFQNTAYDLVIEGESYRSRLKPSIDKAGPPPERPVEKKPVHPARSGTARSVDASRAVCDHKTGRSRLTSALVAAGLSTLTAHRGS
jgi:hypothetical protein